MKALWIALGALAVGGGGYWAYKTWGTKKAVKPSVDTVTTVVVGPTQTGTTPGGLPIYDVGMIPPEVGISTDQLIIEEPDNAQVMSKALRGFAGAGVRIL